MSERRFSAIVLAGGQGTRMKSPLPKVLHPVAGIPMIVYPLTAVKAAGANEVRVVAGYGNELVSKLITPLGVSVHIQAQQLGTADAVRSAKPQTIKDDVLIVNGDHPLVMTDDIMHFYKQFITSGADLALLTVVLDNPGEFGRVIRRGGELRAVVEAKDASPETLEIKEVNTGVYFVKAATLNKYLPMIDDNNVKKEFYLTDIIGLCAEDNVKMVAIRGNERVSRGVNNQTELARATRAIFYRKVKKVMDNGVVVVDPRNTYIEASVDIGAGTVIYPGAYLRGNTRVGQFCVVEPNCQIHNSEIGEGVQIRAGSYLENCKVAKKCIVGPYARLRPETEVAEEAHIGNFVELKKVKMGARSKANHLTYLGDAEIGSDVNIGCGTITCNYAVDKKKYKTKIGNGAFIGSDTQFIAPIEIGDNAVIGSGSTITKDVPANALAVARGKQFVKENYVTKKED